MVISEPEILNEIELSSESASVAVIVPISVSPSSTLNDESDVKVGPASSKSFIETVISWVTEFSPSLTVTVARYDDCVS